VPDPGGRLIIGPDPDTTWYLNIFVTIDKNMLSSRYGMYGISVNITSEGIQKRQKNCGI
jgi:hypothetical protein